MQTSARNQFEGSVTAIKLGAVNNIVEITTAGGVTITALITNESTDRLGLAVGKPAVALVKAPSVIVAAGDGAMRFSARNCLTGKISSVHDGAVNTEVVIALPGGARIAAIVTRESAERLGLAVGTPAVAVFKASSVIVGVPG